MEYERQKETSANTITENEPEVKQTPETRLDDLPRWEDLLKSEQELRPAPELKGLKKVENDTIEEDKTFTKKQDEKNVLVKRRVKILTSIYIAVAALLLTFVGVNAVTLIMFSRDINSNANTIQSKSEQVEIWEDHIDTPQMPSDSIEVSLNPPRDYGDDSRELTFFCHSLQSGHTNHGKLFFRKMFRSSKSKHTDSKCKQV